MSSIFFVIRLLKISREHRPFHQLISCLLSLTVLHLSIKFLIFTLPDIAPLKYRFNTFLDLAYPPLIWMIAKKIRDDRYVPNKHWYLFLPTLAAAVCYTGILVAIFITGKIPTAAIDAYNTVTIYCMIGFFLLFPVLAYRISQRYAAFWKTERKFIHALSGLTFFGGLLCLTDQGHDGADQTGRLYRKILRIAERRLLRSAFPAIVSAALITSRYPRPSSRQSEKNTAPLKIS